MRFSVWISKVRATPRASAATMPSIMRTLTADERQACRRAIGRDLTGDASILVQLALAEPMQSAKKTFSTVSSTTKPRASASRQIRSRSNSS